MGMVMAMTPEQLLNITLSRKECSNWPDCSCYSTLKLWGQNLQDLTTAWKPHELEWGETTIFISLACISTYCPDKDVRNYARRQLQKPFWDRQMSMGI
jgi:hypothetical protein